MRRQFHCFTPQSKDVVDPVMLWKAISNLLFVFGSVFLACEVGQRFSNLFEDVNDQLDRLNWYLFPMKIQQMLPTILINAQEEVVIGYFGIINATRVQCQKVNAT